MCGTGRWIRGRPGVARRGPRRRRPRVPLYEAAEHVVDPRIAGARPVLDDLRPAPAGRHALSPPGAQYAFRYYAECDCLGGAERARRACFRSRRLDGRPTSRLLCVPSSAPPRSIGTAADRAAHLRRQPRGVHGRVWVVYSHVFGRTTHGSRGHAPRRPRRSRPAEGRIRRPGATRVALRAAAERPEEQPRGFGARPLAVGGGSPESKTGRKVTREAPPRGGPPFDTTRVGRRAMGWSDETSLPGRRGEVGEHGAPATPFSAS